MGTCRVLLVEDFEPTRELYRLCLTSSGYEVLEAQTGADAIAVATAEQPDIILMDIGLPDIDGWQATAALKSDARTESIPVIAITAHALQDERERSKHVGCDGFVTKPCLPTALIAEIERIWTAGTK